MNQQQKQRTRRTDIIPIPNVQDYHKAKSTQNPMTHKLFHAPMLLPILYTSAHPKPLKRCDAPISMKLQSNSPYHTAGEMNRDMLQRTTHASNRRWIDN